MPARFVSGDRRAAVRGEGLGRAARIDVGRETEPEVVDDERVALGDVDDEDDVAALGAAPERELDVAEEARAEQAEARELELRVVDVEHVAGAERARSAGRRGRASCVLPRTSIALERVFQAYRAGRAYHPAGGARRGGHRGRGGSRSRRRAGSGGADRGGRRLRRFDGVGRARLGGGTRRRALGLDAPRGNGLSSRERGYEGKDSRKKERA